MNNSPQILRTFLFSVVAIPTPPSNIEQTSSTTEVAFHFLYKDFWQQKFQQTNNSPTLQSQINTPPPGLINRDGECRSPCLESSVDPFHCMSTIFSFF